MGWIGRGGLCRLALPLLRRDTEMGAGEWEQEGVGTEGQAGVGVGVARAVGMQGRKLRNCGNRVAMELPELPQAQELRARFSAWAEQARASCLTMMRIWRTPSLRQVF